MSAAMFAASKELAINELVTFDPQQNADEFFKKTGQYESFDRLRPGLGCNVIIPTVFPDGEKKNLILGYDRKMPDNEPLHALQLSFGGGELHRIGFGYNQTITELLQSKMNAEVAGYEGMGQLFDKLTFDTQVHSNVQSSKKMNYATVMGVAPEMQIGALRALLADAKKAVDAAAANSAARGEKSSLKVGVLGGIYAYDINEVREQLTIVKQQHPQVTEGAQLPETAVTFTNYADAGLEQRKHRTFANIQLQAIAAANKLTDEYIVQISSEKSFTLRP